MPLGGVVTERRRHAPRAGASRFGRAAVLAGVAILVVAGIVLRLHLLTHQPIDGDEAVAGLMADQILHGHFYTFFWGNQYGGGEFYIQAALFALFGSGPVGLNGTAALVTAGGPSFAGGHGSTRLSLTGGAGTSPACETS